MIRCGVILCWINPSTVWEPRLQSARHPNIVNFNPPDVWWSRAAAVADWLLSYLGTRPAALWCCRSWGASKSCWRDFDLSWGLTVQWRAFDLLESWIENCWRALHGRHIYVFCLVQSKRWRKKISRSFSPRSKSCVVIVWSFDLSLKYKYRKVSIYQLNSTMLNYVSGLQVLTCLMQADLSSDELHIKKSCRVGAWSRNLKVDSIGIRYWPAEPEIGVLGPIFSMSTNFEP